MPGACVSDLHRAVTQLLYLVAFAQSPLQLWPNSEGFCLTVLVTTVAHVMWGPIEGFVVNRPKESGCLLNARCHHTETISLWYTGACFVLPGTLPDL